MTPFRGRGIVPFVIGRRLRPMHNSLRRMSLLSSRTTRATRHIATTGAVLLGLALFAGCGSKEGDSSAGAATSTAPAATNAAAELSGTVKWTMLDYGPTVRPWAEKVVKAFEAEHPGV